MRKQSMVAAGLNMKTGKFNERPQCCSLCKAPAVFDIFDGPQRRVSECDECGALHVITKGTSSWWYHDAQLPENMAPVWLARILADIRSTADRGAA